MRMRVGPVRKRAGVRSMGRSQEAGRCEGERIQAQQGSEVQH